MDERDELVSGFQRSQQELHGAVAGLGEEAAEEIWYGRWGVKQIVAHIAGWESAMAEALGKIALGERPSAEGINLSDVDGTNDQFAEKVQPLSFDQVLQDLSSAGGRLVEAIQALPEDRLGEGKTARRIVDTMIRHPAEHTDAIRQWRSAGGSASGPKPVEGGRS